MYLMRWVFTANLLDVHKAFNLVDSDIHFRKVYEAKNIKIHKSISYLEYATN